MSAERSYGRGPGELRPIEIEPGFMRTATGSALISAGETRVICTASAQESVPRWMAGKGRGWLTAEYGMLPASTGDRKQRDATKGRLDGRSVEIQRLIGRSLRGVIDLSAARRTHDLPRLRRAAGRRRHALRLDHGCLRRAGAGVRASAGRRQAGGLAADRLGRGGLLRDGRGGRAAGSRLLRGLDRGGRRERGDDRRGRSDRGAGDGRAHAALARAPGRAAGARGRRGSSGCGRPRSRRSRRRERLLLATHNEHKRREFARLLVGHEVDVLPPR